MLPGILAFLLGIWLLQQQAGLPNPLLLLPALLLIPAARRLPWLRLPLWGLLGFAYAALRAGLLLQPALPPALEGRDLVVQGQVAAMPGQRGAASRFLFDIERPAGLPRRVRLAWYGSHPPLLPGERWRLSVRLKRPHGLYNPGGFDYEGWLFRHAIRATGYVRASPAARRLAPARGHWSERWRAALARDQAAALGEAPQAGLLRALAVGARDGVSRADWTVLRRTGTSHLLAISGLHIGLVVGLVFLLVRRLWGFAWRLPLWLPAPSAGALAGLAAGTAYAALAGFSVPTQRALVMTAVLLGALLAGRTVRPSRSFALALLAVLLYDPLAVLDAGFWLSFGAVALILFSGTGRPGAGGAWWRWGRIHLLLTLGLLPLVLALFGQVSLVAPLANAAAVPWIGLAVLPADLLGTLLLPLWPGLGRILLHVAGTLLGALWWCLERLAALPWVSWQHAPPEGWGIAAAALGVILLLAPRGLPGRGCGALLLLPLLLRPAAAPPVGEAWFTLLDVGQGLAAAVRTRHHLLLYDTGPRYAGGLDAGHAVVVPFVRRLGLPAVDLLLVSHGDDDHAGGADAVLHELKVRRVLSNVPWLRRLGAQPCAAGRTWNWDGVHFAILHPPGAATPGDNNASCVLRVAVGAASVLLPGDIEAPAEGALLRRLGSGLKSSLLVAPHHGSATSSTPAFVAAVEPLAVLFPVGYRNRFHFPRPTVVARYRAIGAATFDTAASGALQVRLGPAGIDGPHSWRRLHRRYWLALPVVSSGR